MSVAFVVNQKIVVGFENIDPHWFDDVAFVVKTEDCVGF